MNVTRRSFIGGSVACALTRGAFAAPDAAGVPAYSAEMAEAFAARVRARAETCADGFFFITDLHIPRNARRSGRIIAALADRTPLRKVLCGGDLPEAFTRTGFTDRGSLEDTVETYRTQWVEPLRTAGLKVYTAKGNHDFTIRRAPQSTEGLTFAEAETRRVVIGESTERDVVLNASDPTGCYYYFDNAAAKVRTIVADTTDSVRTDRAYWAVQYGQHAPQLHWLAERALGTVPAGWFVVVMQHVPITSVVGSDEDVRNFADMRHLLEAYQNRTRVDLSGRRFDFSGAKGRILLDLSGHQHTERSTWQRGILHVTNPCDAAYQDYRYASLACGELPPKKIGERYEQTFDAVQFDLGRNLVHFTRFGGGTDRLYRLEPVKVRVGERLKIEPVLPGPVVGCGLVDADFAAVRKDPSRKYGTLYEFRSTYAEIDASAVVTARTPGESIAWLVHADGLREFVPVVTR